VANPRADYYDVRFFRADQQVFVAAPRAPRLELPYRWVYKGRRYQIAGGPYRWIVRPGFGAPAKKRYGRPIVDSKWTYSS
jgi:hypothetical protein